VGETGNVGCESKEFIEKSRSNPLRFLSKKERWGLTWQGWLALLPLLALAAVAFLKMIHPFLTPTHRMESNTLVVEGWVHKYVINAAVKEFRAGNYHRVFATGGPTSGSGGYTWDSDTSASIGAGELRTAGVPSESLQMVASHVIGRDRTYYSAVALREWFREHNADVDSFNVMAESTHARRTWLLFQEAFGNKVKVGIIAVQNPDYDPRRWWESSDGFRDVISEAIAYLYAKLLFHPSQRLTSTQLRQAGENMETSEAPIWSCPLG
jgi:hypothetical protein